MTEHDHIVVQSWAIYAGTHVLVTGGIVGAVRWYTGAETVNALLFLVALIAGVWSAIRAREAYAEYELKKYYKSTEREPPYPWW